MSTSTDAGVGAAASATAAAASEDKDRDRFFMCNGKRIEIRDVWNGSCRTEPTQLFITKAVPAIRSISTRGPAAAHGHGSCADCGPLCHCCADTLEAELAQIRKLVPKYKYVAMVGWLGLLLAYNVCERCLRSATGYTWPVTPAG
jgi:hypothetical protein